MYKIKLQSKFINPIYNFKKNITLSIVWCTAQLLFNFCWSLYCKLVIQFSYKFNCWLQATLSLWNIYSQKTNSILGSNTRWEEVGHKIHRNQFILSVQVWLKSTWLEVCLLIFSSIFIKKHTCLICTCIPETICILLC